SRARVCAGSRSCSGVSAWSSARVARRRASRIASTQPFAGVADSTRMTNKAEFRSLREEVGERWQPRTTSAREPEASARSQAQDGGSVPPPGRDAALQLFSIYFGESEGAFGVTHDAEHRRNPGRDVMSALDYLHSAKEAVHVAREGVAEEGALGVGETLMAPLAIVNGVGEAMDGIDEYKEATRAGDAQGQGRGLVSVGGGAAGAASGLAPLIGLPGGPVAGSF